MYNKFFFVSILNGIKATTLHTYLKTRAYRRFQLLILLKAGFPTLRPVRLICLRKYVLT